MTDASNFVQIDESQDVAGSIRHALWCWELTINDPHAWKWVILALHSALQGACVCHLLTTAHPIGAVTKKNAGEWTEYFEARRADPKSESPKIQLMAFPELLKAVRKPNSVGQEMVQSSSVAITDAELDWLIRIHMEFRNQFVHFSPMGWSFDVSGMTSLAHLIARIIKDVLDSCWAFRHLDEEWRDMLKKDLKLLSSLKEPIRA